MSEQLSRLRGGPIGIVWSVAAVVVLAVVAVLSFDLLTGDLPISAHGPSGSGAPNVGPAITPTPSNVVEVPEDPRSKVPGEIAYVKDGNIWVQSGTTVRQLTSAGTDSMPTFSPDGRWIYYVETYKAQGRYACGSAVSVYAMVVPQIMRIAADGSGRPKVLKSGLFHQGSLTWFSFLREPVPSPNGTQLALVSDAPRPCSSDVVLQFLNLSNQKLTSARAVDNPPLGDQDPAWAPDGKTLFYVANGRDGARGTPVVYRYDTRTRRSTAVTGPGYLQPSVSPDGRYLAVTHLDTVGSDIVVLDATNGQELLRVTTDESSTAPSWSPAGDAIVYLHIQAGICDLVMVNLSGTAPAWTLSDPIPLTQLAGLDPASRPSWFAAPG
jgi:Tol biopolymer transport system component